MMKEKFRSNALILMLLISVQSAFAKDPLIIASIHFEKLKLNNYCQPTTHHQLHPTLLGLIEKRIINLAPTSEIALLKFKWCKLSISNYTEAPLLHSEILITHSGSNQPFGLFINETGVEKFKYLSKDVSGDSFLVPSNASLYRLSIPKYNNLELYIPFTGNQLDAQIELYNSASLYTRFMQSLFGSGILAACLLCLPFIFLLQRHYHPSNYLLILVIIINYIIYPVPKPSFLVAQEALKIEANLSLMTTLLALLVYECIRHPIIRALMLMLVLGFSLFQWMITPSSQWSNVLLALGGLCLITYNPEGFVESPNQWLCVLSLLTNCLVFSENIPTAWLTFFAYSAIATQCALMLIKSTSPPSNHLLKSP